MILFQWSSNLNEIFSQFRARSCSKDFQSFFVNSKEVERKDIYLLRPHATPETVISGSINDKGHSDLFVEISGFCDKFEKVCE